MSNKEKIKGPMYLVMLMSYWEDVSVGAGSLVPPPTGEGPEAFIPVFFDKAHALEWAGGDENLVREVAPIN